MLKAALLCYNFMSQAREDSEHAIPSTVLIVAVHSGLHSGGVHSIIGTAHDSWARDLGWAARWTRLDAPNKATRWTQFLTTTMFSWSDTDLTEAIVFVLEDTRRDIEKSSFDTTRTYSKLGKRLFTFSQPYMDLICSCHHSVRPSYRVISCAANKFQAQHLDLLSDNSFSAAEVRQ